MAQLFHRNANILSKSSLAIVVGLVAVVGWAANSFQRSPFVTYQGLSRTQPVPFSHQHHVAGLGIDCRYCHTSVEVSAVAGIPPVKTCMNCHSQIWTNAPMLEPVRDSFRTGKPLIWSKVNDLPDFVYFNHSIHINKGVGCNTCHGPVDQMPYVYTAASLQMEWCLECHRAPEKFLRPRDQVFNMRYRSPASGKPGESSELGEKVTVAYNGHEYSDQQALGRALVSDYHLRTVQDITSCSTCHR
jgi:hypothetical protein